MGNIDDLFKSMNRISLLRDEEMKFFKYKKQRNKLYTVNAYNKNKQLIWSGYNTPEEQIEEYKSKYELLK